MYARSAAVALSLLVLLLPPLVHADDSRSARSGAAVVDDAQCEPSQVDVDDPAAIAELFAAGDPWGDLLVTCAEAAGKTDRAETGLAECDDSTLVEEMVPELDGFFPLPGDPCAFLLNPFAYPGLSPAMLLAQYRACQLSADTDDGDCLTHDSDILTESNQTTTL